MSNTRIGAVPKRAKGHWANRLREHGPFSLMALPFNYNAGRRMYLQRLHYYYPMETLLPARIQDFRRVPTRPKVHFSLCGIGGELCEAKCVGIRWSEVEMGKRGVGGPNPTPSDVTGFPYKCVSRLC